MKTRIISAIVAAIIAVPLIVVGGIYFNLGVCLLAILGFKEIVDLKKAHNEFPNLMVIFGVFCIMFLVFSNNREGSIYGGIEYQYLAIMGLCMMLPTIFYKNEKYTTKDAFYLLGSVLFIGISFNLFTIVRLRGLNEFLLLLLIPIVNDTLAYFIGSAIGKHKMSKISPKKTWEGSIGGLVLGSLAGIIYYNFLIEGIDIRSVLMIFTLSAVGQMGDLVMSKIKRENEIKDFSNIMPGHGGILDRLDSSIFVFLAYVLLMTV